MEGLNYEFHCYHSGDIIDQIFINMDIGDSQYDSQYALDDGYRRGDVSPRCSATSCGGCNSSYSAVNSDGVNSDGCEYLRQQAIDLAQQANIFSDIPFLYAPCEIAFAIAAIVTGAYTTDNNCKIGSKLVHQYMDMYPEKSPDELNTIASTLRDIILNLKSCPNFDFCPSYHGSSTTSVATERAEELRRVISEVATLRLLRKLQRKGLRHPHYLAEGVRSSLSFGYGSIRGQVDPVYPVNSVNTLHYSSKRTRTQYETDFTPPHLIRQCANITPMSTIMYNYRLTRQRCFSRNEDYCSY
jgi:hypothetical protein